jgi:hypothetical protein
MANTKKSWLGRPTTNLLAANGGDTAVERASNAYGYYAVDITAQVLAQWTASNNTITISFEGKRNDAAGGYPAAYLYFTDWTWAMAAGPTDANWTYYTLTGTMPNPAGKGIYFNIYHMPNASTGLSFSRNHQVEWGSYPTRYTPGTRSNTQSVIDLTGSRTITANVLQYNSDNTYSFDGSTTFMSTPNTGMVHGTGGFTYSAWIKWNGLMTNGTLFENGLYTGGILIRYQTNVLQIYSMYTATTYTNSISWVPTLGVWYHFVLTRVGDNLYLYANGVQVGTCTFGTSINVVPSTGTLYIGMSQHTSPGECHNGYMGTIGIYNRALSLPEIQQNFNAHRGRYGV